MTNHEDDGYPLGPLFAHEGEVVRVRSTRLVEDADGEMIGVSTVDEGDAVLVLPDVDALAKWQAARDRKDDADG